MHPGLISVLAFAAAFFLLAVKMDVFARKTWLVDVERIQEPPGGADGWQASFVAARAQALAEKKMLLVNFTGSDWCPACQTLEREVFATAPFKEYARRRLVLLRLDFPARRPLPSEVAQQNRRLASEFGVHAYPTILVFNPEGRRVFKGHARYSPGNPGWYVSELQKLEAN